jgi:hypothetical protein
MMTTRTRHGRPSKALVRAMGLTYLHNAIVTGDYANARRWAKLYAKTISTDPDEWKRLVKIKVPFAFGPHRGTKDRSPEELAAIEARILGTPSKSAKQATERAMSTEDLLERLRYLAIGAQVTRARGESVRSFDHRLGEYDRVVNELKRRKALPPICASCMRPIDETPVSFSAEGQPTKHYHEHHAKYHA